MGKKTSTSASKTSSKNADSASTEKKTKRKGTKHGAKKGKQFERQIATELGHIFPDAQRMLEYQGSKGIGVDLENTDIFRIQCKCWANYANPNVIFEIRESAPHVPVLVTKANNRPTMAVLPFQEFVTLLEIAYGHRERLVNPYIKEREIGALEQSVLAPRPPAMISPPLQQAPISLGPGEVSYVDVQTTSTVEEEQEQLTISSFL